MKRSEGMPFSYEQRDFWDSSARTPGEAMDRSIPHGQEVQYLIDQNERLSPTNLYQQLSSVALELDSAYGDDLRMGESFMDGVSISGDVIDRYVPCLFQSVELAIEGHINEQFEKTYTHLQSKGFYTDAQQREFVDYFLEPERHFTPKFSPEFEPVVKRVAAYKYGEEYQKNVLKTSFEFVMIHAEYAYHADVKKMRKTAESARLGQTIIEAAELDEVIQKLLDPKQ